MEKFARNRFEADLVKHALEDESFRNRLVAAPREVYAEALRAARPGQEIPEGVEIRVVEEAENVFYVVVPFIPPEMDLDEARLRGVANHELTHRLPCWGLGDAPDA